MQKPLLQNSASLTPPSQQSADLEKKIHLQSRQKKLFNSQAERKPKDQQAKTTEKQSLNHNSFLVPFPYKKVSFRKCLQEVGRDGKYQQNFFAIMTCFWISASLFLAFSFYLFQKPHYFLSQQQPCMEYDNDCINQVCSRFYPDKIEEHVSKDESLTYLFRLFCPWYQVRVFYKSACMTLAFIGLLIYGTMADLKGRKIALKISWRFYTIGVMMLSLTQTHFLIMFGYFIACVNCFPALIMLFILMFETMNDQMRMRSFLIILASGLMGSVLSLLFSEFLFPSLGISITLLITCALPAFCLCFVLSYIEQSPKFLYKNDKIKAFNAVNRIARKNQSRIILIDLGLSQWVRLENYHFNILALWNTNYGRKYMVVSFVFLLITFFNSKSAQVSLDLYTDSHLRGLIVNGVTALAYVTLILTKLRLKFDKLLLICLLLNLTYFTLINLGQPEKRKTHDWLGILAIVNLALVRYFCQMIYGTLLIRTMEHSVTVVRGQSLGLILSSLSLGEGMVRIIQPSYLAYALLNVGVMVLGLWLESLGWVEFGSQRHMKDTLKGHYYDENDQFTRITPTLAQT